MTQTLRDKIAKTVWDDRYRYGKGTSFDVADAILSVIAESVEPLVWVGVEADCFVTCDTESHTYDLGVSDTLERPHDYVWTERAVPHLNPHVSRSFIGSGSFDEVVESANKHRRATILSAIGLVDHTPRDE